MEAPLAGRKSGPDSPRRFLVMSTASIVWLVTLQNGATSNYLFGLTLLGFLFAIALARLAAARTHADRRVAFPMLLPLFLVDTSTFVRARATPLVGAAGLTNDSGPTVVGTLRSDGEGGFLYLRGIVVAAGDVNVGPTLLLRGVQTGEPLSGQTLSLTGHTYNDASIHVEASEESRLEWRDAYFPSWRAWVNGREVPIEHTSAGMKAVQVPRGASDVVFRFSPTALRILVGLSFLPIIVAAAMYGAARSRRGRRLKPA